MPPFLIIIINNTTTTNNNNSDDGSSSPSSSSTSEVTAQVTSILIAAGLPKTLSNMKERAWSDSDVVGDIETLYNALMVRFNTTTTSVHTSLSPVSVFDF